VGRKRVTLERKRLYKDSVLIDEAREARGYMESQLARFADSMAAKGYDLRDIQNILHDAAVDAGLMMILEYRSKDAATKE
jgi:hypothetical protein